jgi:hypothetical protein
VWVGLLVTLFVTVVIPVGLFAITLPQVIPARQPQPTTPRCETHWVYPGSGDAFPMTVCR